MRLAGGSTKLSLVTAELMPMPPRATPGPADAVLIPSVNAASLGTFSIRAPASRRVQNLGYTHFSTTALSNRSLMLKKSVLALNSKP